VTPSTEAEDTIGHEEDDTEGLPADSIWQCLCTVEEEDFLREIHRSIQGLGSGTLERWVHQNEIKYPRKDPGHWRRLAKADAGY
jgi:hypothetical protein